MTVQTLEITPADVAAQGGDFVNAAVAAVLDRHSKAAEVVDVDGEDPGRYIEISVDDRGTVSGYAVSLAG